uniref:ABC transporter substrate-binding protein n=1 Tax=Ndongobacter massiliensis TaxID=1871025 RepID=UPI0009318BD6|nr:ABC transporter substrate-binding protein [Ndongobacter massiliensis]
MKFWKYLFCVLLLLVFCGCSSASSGEVVNVYNWGEYIDKELLDDFERETGIHVVYSNFTTNEDLYTKLKNGGAAYDVIVPSEYMAERMMKESMLRPISDAGVPNRKEVDPWLLQKTKDPQQKYTVPCFWGTLGILYNRDLVKSSPTSWSILWDETYRREIVMMDSARDSIGVALKRLGYSMNERRGEALEQAKELLIAQYPLVYAYLVDQTKDLMKNNEAALALMYSGDAWDAMRENPALDYVIPEEGTNLWFDFWCIPADAPNPENAERFIDFMLRPENAARNAEYVGYSLPSSAARALLPEEEQTSKVAYPAAEVIEKGEIFEDLGDAVRVYNDLWQDVRNR